MERGIPSHDGPEGHRLDLSAPSQVMLAESRETVAAVRIYRSAWKHVNGNMEGK